MAKLLIKHISQLITCDDADRVLQNAGPAELRDYCLLICLTIAS